MPQMMPINWLMSFIFFICIFLIFNMINYYIMYFNFYKNEMLNMKKKNFSWKW